MTKQQRLNLFLNDFSAFLEQYYSSSIVDISSQTKNEWVELIIDGSNESKIVVSSDGEEITIMFGESHWHIDDYNEPLQYSIIYENTVNSILEILNGDLGTFSCWVGEKTIGGASFLKSEISNIVDEVLDSKYFNKAEKIHVKYWNENIKIVSVV